MVRSSEWAVIHNAHKDPATYSSGKVCYYVDNSDSIIICMKHNFICSCSDQLLCPKTVLYYLKCKWVVDV